LLWNSEDGEMKNDEVWPRGGNKDVSYVEQPGRKNISQLFSHSRVDEAKI
jgi:hypothetical protein